MAEMLTMARPYAKAIYDIANSGNAENWSQIMRFFLVLGEDASFRDFLKRQDLSNQTIEEAIFSMLERANISVDSKSEFSRFIRLLARNKRFSLLPDIAFLFVEKMNQANQTLAAEIIVAKPITDAEKSNLIHRLNEKYAKTVEASIRVDASIIAGAIIKIGDTVIDGSVKGRLEQLSKALN